jgi:hypothetical protein
MDKETLICKRQEFFDAILQHLNTPPSKIDRLLNQDKYYIKPHDDGTFVKSDCGDMVIQITGQFYDKKFEISYLFWQLGDTLKIGIVVNDDDLQGAFASDAHNEVYYIWGVKNEPRVDVARGLLLYDWEFSVPDLYENYKNQERFIIGTKHMHVRAMRIIHDQCERMFFNTTSDNDDDEPLEGFGSIEDVEKMIKTDLKKK